MIDPTADDVGRPVAYQKVWIDSHGHCHLKIEDGVITSFNDSFVFVRYGNDKNSKATLRQDLKWK